MRQRLMNGILVMSLMLMMTANSSFSEENSADWQKIPADIYENNIKRIALHPKRPSLIYAGTDKALYAVELGGAAAKAILTLPGSTHGVYKIYIDPENPQNIYAATDIGLYESRNEGKSFERIYFSSDAPACFTVVKDHEMIFVGTAKGLFVKQEQETAWHPLDGEFRHESVYFSAEDEDFLYFAVSNKLFGFHKKTRRLTTLFFVGVKKTLDVEEELSTDPINHSLIKFVSTAFSGGTNELFLAAANGIYLSNDQGKNWQKWPAENIPLENLTALKVITADISAPTATGPVPEGYRAGGTGRNLLSPVILVSTKRGIYLYVQDKWLPLYKGLETNDVRDILQTPTGEVYAATPNALYQLSRQNLLLTLSKGNGPLAPADYQHLQESLAGEPSIQEVQQWAVDYAEVNPNKITTWRELAQKRAWLPTLKMGMDEGRSWDISDTISVSSTTSKDNPNGTDRVGPDDKSFGRDIGWGVDLSWDLGNLIWSSDQTSIDTRSKLMVELREDILDQTTRTYFERRRVQAELLNNTSLDQPAVFDREMRIAELTALIDAFTGGKFSAEITRRKALLQDN